MDGIDALRPWSVGHVARTLELHPFEVVRLLASTAPVPPDLRLRTPDVERVIAAGGLEMWWEEPPAAARGESAGPGVARALARELLTRGVVEPTWTRADNLVRGLESGARGHVRQAVETWLRAGVLASRRGPRSLELTVRAGSVAELRALAERGQGAYARLVEDR